VGVIPLGYPAREETYLQRQRASLLPTKAGWYAVLADPQMPVTSTLLDQAHTAIDRKLFMMKGFHHPDGSQAAFLTGLAHLYNLVPYQRRAQHAGQCGVEVEGGRLPTMDWFLNAQILTSGGFADDNTLHHIIRRNVEIFKAAGAPVQGARQRRETRVCSRTWTRVRPADRASDAHNTSQPGYAWRRRGWERRSRHGAERPWPHTTSGW
jgi:hypothetical protein